MGNKIVSLISGEMYIYAPVPIKFGYEIFARVKSKYSAFKCSKILGHANCTVFFFYILCICMHILIRPTLFQLVIAYTGSINYGSLIYIYTYILSIVTLKFREAYILFRVMFFDNFFQSHDCFSHEQNGYIE